MGSTKQRQITNDEFPAKGNSASDITNCSKKIPMRKQTKDNKSDKDFFKLFSKSLWSSVCGVKYQAN